ncbi:MAG: hypothetical protein HC835_06610 [Oscillatoriales cyanobacterium RM2_1_1]|nr:hypothetical protein [Oscillatoriales cyanobacterium SM2_3_0]NJO45320.1 hypothetical protein [Oscillatoriales cyanobacterium RM2_1_1]
MFYQAIKIQITTRLTRLLERPSRRSLSFLGGLCLVMIMLIIELLFSKAASVPVQAPTVSKAQISAMTLLNPIPNSIFRRWIHSREEDQGNILVYRPIDYPFPPARGREGLEFRENGEFIRYQIGPTDRSLAVPGQWQIQEPDVVEVQFPSQSVPSYILTILECNQQILKVKKSERE